MRRCRYCGWHAIAPSRSVGDRQYETHLLDEHVEEIGDAVSAGRLRVTVAESVGDRDEDGETER